MSADPVGLGLVDSLARPGGNATGFTPSEFGNSGKWLELLKEMAPRVERTRPRQINLLGAKDFRSDSLDSPDHFVGGSAGKRQQQDTVRINPPDDKMGNPMGESLRLPRASANYHPKRRSLPRRFGTYAMLYGAALLLVQISQIVRGHDCQPLLIRSSTSRASPPIGRSWRWQSRGRWSAWDRINARRRSTA